MNALEKLIADKNSSEWLRKAADDLLKRPAISALSDAQVLCNAALETQRQLVADFRELPQNQKLTAADHSRFPRGRWS